MALNNRDRRNGLILSNSYRNSQQRSYGKYNKRKAKYNLNDLVLDINKDHNTMANTNDFDISNDSFKMTDDDEDQEGEDDHKQIEDGEMANASSDDDFGDEPYSNAQIINISISDNEDSDVIMESPEKKQPIIKSTPQKKSSKQKKVLQDLSSPKLNINTDTINDKRIPLASTPNFQRNSSAGLSQFRNRSSLNSNSSKRWSLLSFNNEDKENVNTTNNNNNNNNKSKRFSIVSTQSNSSKDKSSKRFSIASTSSLTDSKNKRFSIASTQSTSSGNSIKNVISRVGNALSSVSVSSLEDTSETNTPYKNIKPGVVGENLKRSSTSSNILSESNFNNAPSPIPMRTYSQASISSTNININTSYHSREKEYQQQHHQFAGKNAKDTDNISMLSSSSIRTSKSRFRLSSIFSSKKNENSNNDNESIRSLRGKNSLSDMRKSVLSMSPSKHNLFRLAKKDSISDLNKKTHLDKTMISLPRPDTNSREKLKTRLRNSSSIISINSIISRQPTNQQPQPQSQQSLPPLAPTLTNTTMMTTNEYEAKQLENLVKLTNYPEVLNFKDYVSVIGTANNQVLIKFAEASYSEVYLLKNFETNEILRIFKIIPFGDGNFEQPSIDNVIQELKITKKLSSIEGFIKINESCIVKGCYPRLLLKLWDDFNELKESCNYRPEFDQDQKYLIMDLEYGGIDLEKFEINNWEQCLQIFWSIVKILDKGEKNFKFEHRDLHWGNIVIKETNDTSNNDEIEDALKDLSIIEETEEDLQNDETSSNKLQVKLIDYTLSRLDGENEMDVIYTRLDHQDFFKGCGDYQFDIYRFMRNQIKSIQKIDQHNDEIDWSLSSFINNLYWLHYLLDKLINHKRIPTTKKDDQYYKDLIYLYKSLDPRRKKLNDSIPQFNQENAKSNKKRQVVYFQDFKNCADVLKFGEYYGLIH